MSKSFISSQKETKRGSLSGVRICGSQVFDSVIGAAGTTGCIGASSSRSSYLSPSQVGQPLSNIAANYRRYYFRKFTLRFVSQASTSSSNAIALAWDDDPVSDSAGYDTIFEVGNRNYSSVQPIYNGQGQAAAVSVDLTKSTDEPYYTNTGGSATTDPEIRQTYQGRLIGCLGGAPTATTSYGWLMIDYEVELLDMIVGGVSAAAFLSPLSRISVLNHPEAIELRRKIHELWLRYNSLDKSSTPVEIDPGFSHSSTTPHSVVHARSQRPSVPLARSRPSSPSELKLLRRE